MTPSTSVMAVDVGLKRSIPVSEQYRNHSAAQDCNIQIPVSVEIAYLQVPRIRRRRIIHFGLKRPITVPQPHGDYVFRVAQADQIQLAISVYVDRCHARNRFVAR